MIKFGQRKQKKRGDKDQEPLPWRQSGLPSMLRRCARCCCDGYLKRGLTARRHVDRRGGSRACPSRNRARACDGNGIRKSSARSNVELICRRRTGADRDRVSPNRRRTGTKIRGRPAQSYRLRTSSRVVRQNQIRGLCAGSRTTLRARRGSGGAKADLYFASRSRKNAGAIIVRRGEIRGVTDAGIANGQSSGPCIGQRDGN